MIDVTTRSDFLIQRPGVGGDDACWHGFFTFARCCVPSRRFQLQFFSDQLPTWWGAQLEPVLGPPLGSRRAEPKLVANWGILGRPSAVGLSLSAVR